MRRHRQIALLGFPGVGKSSLAHHYVYKHFYNEYDPNIKTNLRHECVINGQEYVLSIVDNAGSDQYTLNHIDFENSDAYVIVYAIDDIQSFKMASKIREKIMQTSPMAKIPMVLVGNKIDRNDDRVVSNEDGKNLANSWRVPFVEASAMDFRAVEEIFEKSIKAIDHADSSFENGSTENSAEHVTSRRSSNSSTNTNPNAKKQPNRARPSTQQQKSQPCSLS